ncbi:MAG: cupin [Verrucomicrobia bacterium]|nr:MAG: cupin [Verrucomicrobiota bacterium]
MRKINISEIKEEPWRSPRGKYAVSFKGISEALGRDRGSFDLAKRHPFDLEWNRIPPGKSNFPYHAHSAQWELYLIISGEGSLRHKDGITEVVAGDVFNFGPDEAHQLTNSVSG